MMSNKPVNEMRYEIKIPLTGVMLYQLKRFIQIHPSCFKVLYPKRQVNNIYFDTYDFAAFQNHLFGYSERTKYRLRWYGESNCFSESQFELKQKHGQVGNKQQYFINEKFDLESQNWGDIKKNVLENVPAYQREIISGQHPVLINKYLREYYQSIDKKIRLTIDYDIKWFTQNTFTKPTFHLSSAKENTIILELKAGTDFYKEIVQTINYFPFRSAAISKYITGLTS